MGVHSTENLNDSYVGSGILLFKAIKKHGLKNFRRHILMMCESKEEALSVERIIVDYDFIHDENTYNVALGGVGGNLDNTSLVSRKRSSERLKRLHAEGLSHAPDWTGRTHRPETKTKIGLSMRVAQLGQRNSQSGKVWISHHTLKISKRVPRSELQELLTQGWTLGRRMNWQ